MKKATPAALAILLALSAADKKPTSATYVPSDDVQATLKRAPEGTVSDQQIRVVDVGRVNVGIGAVYRSQKAPQQAVEHDQMTEVYHVMEGSGTLVTGGAIVNPQRRGPDHPSVRDLNGPSINGTALQNGAIDAGTIQVADRRMVGPPALGIYNGASCHKGPGALHDVVDLRHLVVLDGLLWRFLGPVDCADPHVDSTYVNHANLLIAH